MERHGRSLLLESDRTAEEQERLASAMATARREYPERIHQKGKALDRLISPYNSFDVMSQVMLVNLMVGPDELKEGPAEKETAIIEYVCLLCVKGPFNPGSSRLIPGEVLERVNSEAKAILDLTLWWYMTEAFDEDARERAGELLEARYLTVLDSLFVRNPGYAVHRDAVLRQLFSEPWTDELLRKRLGLTITEQLKVAEAVEQWTNDRLYEHLAESAAALKQAQREVALYRRKRKVTGGLPVQVLRKLGAMKPSEAKQSLTNVACSYFLDAIGDRQSFAAEQMASHCGLEPRPVEKFLEHMSLTFGYEENFSYLPSATNPLLDRPIVKHERQYLCPVPYQLGWALKKRIEEMLTTTKQWQRYERRRASVLTDLTVDVLRKALSAPDSYSNLVYTVTEGGRSKRVELDGLVKCDTHLLLAEFKAGAFTKPALRGAPRRLRTDLKKLVADAHAQATRAYEYIQVSDAAAFTEPAGRTIIVEKSALDKTYLVNVTLDPVGPLQPYLHRLTGSSIFPETVPWSVWVLDLMAICDLIDMPATFFHYLQRRQRLSEVRFVTSSDELDYFMHYLKEGLSFEGIPWEGIHQVQIGTYTAEADRYFLTKRREAKPQQLMPTLLREILEEMQGTRKPGYMSASTGVLELDTESREEFCRRFALVRQRTRKDKSRHDFTFLFGQHGPAESHFGLTVITTPLLPDEQIKAELGSYCALKKYQTKAAYWVGLGCCPMTPNYIDALCILKYAWVFDQNMDEQAAARLKPLPQ